MIRRLVILAALTLPAAAQTASPGPRDPFARWLSYNTRGWAAVYKKDLPRAESLFRTCIEAAREESATDPRLLARSYADLAWVLHLTGRADQARPLARWALTVREAYQPETYAHAQCLYFNAAIEADLGRPDRAAEYMTRALPIVREQLVRGVELSRYRDVLARACLDLRRLDDADGLYSENLDVDPAVLAADDPLRLAALDGRAAVALARGDLEHAVEFYRREADAEAQSSPRHPDLARTLAKLADACRRAGRAAEAEAAEAQIRSLGGGPAPPRPGPST